LHSCTWKKVRPPTKCATTVFDVFAAKQSFASGTGSFTESDVNAAAYEVTDDMDASSGAKASYIVSSRTADGEVPQQQCVIESNDGESTGLTSIGPATAVQVDLDVTGADMSLGISGAG
jgi:hypothetical protein